MGHWVQYVGECGITTISSAPAEAKDAESA